jgi:hypothetical protein
MDRVDMKVDPADQRESHNENSGSESLQMDRVYDSSCRSAAMKALTFAPVKHS